MDDDASEYFSAIFIDRKKKFDVLRFLFSPHKIFIQTAQQYNSNDFKMASAIYGEDEDLKKILIDRKSKFLVVSVRGMRGWK